MEAERAWSYAMQLKQEANTEPRKRFHLLARLRKAAKHGERLEKLCESPGLCRCQDKAGGTGLHCLPQGHSGI